MPSCLAAVASWQVRPAACILHSMACAMSCAICPTMKKKKEKKEMLNTWRSICGKIETKDKYCLVQSLSIS